MRGVDSKEGMDSANIILAPIRACAPEPIHCHEGSERRVRQAAEGLCVWSVRKIGELEPRVGTEGGGSLALTG